MTMKQLLQFLVLFGLIWLTPLALRGADYFWVGGSGNWADLSHWATTSGGTTRHTVVPTANDNVIFDALSFPTAGAVVSVTAQTIFCRNMDWRNATGNPRFNGPNSSEINLFGSLYLNGAMQYNFAGNVNFLAKDGGHEIDLQGQRLRRLATFLGPNGQWTVRSAFSVDSTLVLTEGNLSSSGQAIRCELLVIQPTTSFNWDCSGGTVTVTGVPFRIINFDFEDRPVVDVYPQNLTLNATGATWELSSSNAFLRLRSFGPIALGTLRFSNTTGDARLQIDANTVATIEVLALNNDTRVSGTGATINTLRLGPGKTYQFQGGSTYTLNRVQALGQCASPIQLFSNTNGTPAIFSSNADTLAVDFAFIRDITGVGTARFLARNSTNLGNSTGWTFVPKPNSALYWVGGTGSWSDPNHWSFTSGGPGGACVPGGGDNVFFDANSFPTPGAIVTIDVENAYCRSMTWTGATGRPILAGILSRNLHLFGSLTFIPNMTLAFAGDVYFEASEANQTIASAGKIMPKNTYFNGSGGWVLQDSLNVAFELYFIRGNLNTNSKSVTVERFLSEGNLPRTLTLGNTYWSLRFTPRFFYLSFNLNSENLTFDAGNSHVDFRWFGGVFQYGQNGQLRFNRMTFRASGSLACQYQNSINFVDSLASYGDVGFSATTDLNQWDILGSVSSNTIQIGDTVLVNVITNVRGCSSSHELRSTIDNNKAFLVLRKMDTLRQFFLRDIQQIGPKTIIAAQSQDLGNNTGFDFSNTVGRNLYWVGGDGIWHDPVHWSLSSGGPGGECIPTPADNVFFDANSFSAAGQRVRNPGSHAYCKTMLWDATVRPGVAMEMHILHLFGSIRLQPGLSVPFFNSLYLRTPTPDQIISTDSIRVGSVFISGAGSWKLESPFLAYGMYHYFGDFNSAGQAVTTNYYWAYETNPITLRLDSSHWRITGDALSFTGSWNSNTLRLIPGTSLVEFTSPQAALQTNLNTTFHNVLFSSLTGTSELRTGYSYSGAPRAEAFFNRLEFRNNGLLLGANTVDSLIFTAGKSYRLDVLQDQTVKEFWQVIGNNCSPIVLSSTQTGTKAEVLMNSGTILGDFIQMRDQRGVGSIRFLAGQNSTNIGNSNENWIFEAPADFVDAGILGADKVLCRNNTAVLDANANNPGERYRWSTGSTDAVQVVTQPGVYWVDVTFANNCTIRDSIRVLPAADFAPQLPPDTAICAGQTLRVDPQLDLVGLRYRWQDGSTGPVFAATQPGKIRLALELSGCTVVDSFNLTVNPLPSLNLGPDQLLCPGETATLNATTANASYRWQDGSSNATFLVNQAGVYTAQVTVAGCSASDSVRVQYQSPLGLNLGRDTFLCENSSYVLTPNVTADSYRWSDGSQGSSLTVSQPGRYRLTATRNNCTETDSIVLTLQALPRFELGADTAICQGQALELRPQVTGVGNSPISFQWQDGLRTANRRIDSTGRFQLTAQVRGCTFTDERSITVNALPVFSLGPDQTLCVGERAVLNATTRDATYRWQDSTATPLYSVTTTGQYRVSVTVAGCSSADSVDITFNPLPQLKLGSDTTLCTGQSLAISLAEPGASYRWSDSLRTGARSISQAGTYRVEATLQGCTASDTLTVAYIDLPVGILGPDTALCAGETLTLNIQVAGASIRWGDGNTVAQRQFNQSGAITLELSAQQCRVQDTLAVVFKPLPILPLGTDTTLCQGETLPIAGGDASATYRWNDGQTGAARSLSQAGLYWLEGELNGCQRRDSLRIQVIALPQRVLGVDTALCQGENLVLALNLPGVGLLWPDGSTGNQYRPTQTGAVVVRLRQERCTLSDTLQVTFKPLPTLALGNDTVLCAGQQLLLDAGMAAGLLRWEDGSTQARRSITQTGIYWVEGDLAGCKKRDTLRASFTVIPPNLLGADTTLCEGSTFQRQLNLSGATYRWQDGSTQSSYRTQRAERVRVQVQVGNCVATDSVQVSFQALPRFSLGPDTVLCAGENLLLNIGVTAERYQWDNNSPSSSRGVAASGLFIGQAFIGRCGFSDSIRVSVVNLPLVNLGPDTTVCADEPLTLRLGVPAREVLWSEGSRTPTLVVPATGDYWVRISEGRCQRSDTIAVTIKNCTAFKLFVPNAFSPNDDGANDWFQPQTNPEIAILEYQLLIFDRWGNLVFQSTDWTRGWDGQSKGEKAPQGVYLYAIQVRYRDDKKEDLETVRGDVLLLR